MDPYFHTKLISLLAIIMTIWFTSKVGGMRRKHGVKAPKTEGPEEFNQVYRAHQNTLEMLILFFPTLWIFASSVNDLYAGILGTVWIIGRILYFYGYSKDPKKRGTGFMISFIVLAVMVIWTLVKLLLQII